MFGGGGPGYGRRESSRRALSPCPPAIRLRLARTPFLTSGGERAWGACLAEGARVCVYEFSRLPGVS